MVVQTGYLTGNYTTAFNLGKQEEVENRVKHNRFMKEEEINELHGHK